MTDYASARATQARAIAAIDALARFLTSGRASGPRYTSGRVSWTGGGDAFRVTVSGFDPRGGASKTTRHELAFVLYGDEEHGYVWRFADMFPDGRWADAPLGHLEQHVVRDPARFVDLWCRANKGLVHVVSLEHGSMTRYFSAGPVPEVAAGGIIARRVANASANPHTALGRARLLRQFHEMSGNLNRFRRGR